MPDPPEPPSDASDLSEGVPDESAYGTRIEDAFIAERGTPFLLGPRDWQLIKSWRERGIPADTVIRGVREAFERRRRRATVGKVNSLDYCENAVEERWEMERRGLVGKGDAPRETPETPPGERLAALVARLREVTSPASSGAPLAHADPKALGKTLGKAIEKVAALDPTLGWDQLEEALTRIEGKLLSSLEKALDEETRRALGARVEEDLGAPGGVSAEVRERTRKALARREVRRTLGLPPLTLFDV